MFSVSVHNVCSFIIVFEIFSINPTDQTKQTKQYFIKLYYLDCPTQIVQYDERKLSLICLFCLIYANFHKNSNVICTKWLQVILNVHQTCVLSFKLQICTHVQMRQCSTKWHYLMRHRILRDSGFPEFNNCT